MPENAAEPDIRIQVAADADIEGCAIVSVDGAVTASHAATFQREIQKHLPPDMQMLVFQMGKVSYLSSSAFSYLVDLATGLERKGGVTVLVDLQPKVRIVIDNLGIARFFRQEGEIAVARAFVEKHAQMLHAAPRVLVIEGPNEGSEYPVLGTAIKIGGDPRSTITLRYPGAEYRHAEIYRTGDQCHVRDLGTSTGTTIGGRKVYDEPLKTGDVIVIGRLKLKYAASGR